MQVNPQIFAPKTGAVSGQVKSKPSAEAANCPFTGESFTQATSEAGCPYMAAKAKLEAAARSAAKPEMPTTALQEVADSTAQRAALGTGPAPTLLGTAKTLGLDFRRQGKTLSFTGWKPKWRSLSAEKALEMAAKYRAFETRTVDGNWSPVGSFEELKVLIAEAEKEAKKQQMLGTAAAAAQMVTDSMVGLPVSLGSQEISPPEAVGAPKEVGLLTFARGMARHYTNPVGFLQEFHGKFGRSFSIDTPTHGKFLFDTRPDVLMDALRETDGAEDRFKKSELQGHGASFLIGEKNMFTSGGQDWQVISQALRPHLGGKTVNSPEMVTKLTGIFDDHLADLKARAKAAPDGVIEFDAREEMQTAVLDVALQLFFSTKLSKPELKNLQDAFNTQMSWLPEETVNPTNISLANVPGNGKLKEAYKTLDAMAGKILEQRKSSPEKPGDVLDSLREAKDPTTGEPLSDERVKHEILALMEAGHETTATMMGWSLVMLSRNPSEYKSLQTEVDSVVGTDAPGEEAIRDLPKAENIVKETLRMYPPFYLFMREAKEDVTVGKPGEQVKIEKGTTLVSSLYEAHRDEGLWGEEKSGYPANEFHSARFDEKGGERFIPFGAGKRSCIGQVLGRLEGNLMLTRLAQDFDIMPEEHKPIELKSDLSIHPKDGTVRLKLRQPT